MVDAVAADRTEDSLRSSMASRFGVKNLESSSVTDWIESHSESVVRAAMAKAAKGAKSNGRKDESAAWFKREDRGEQLGAIVATHLPSITDPVLLAGLSTISHFAYGADLVAAGVLTDAVKV